MPNFNVNFSGSSFAPDFPTAIMILPQFESEPDIAVLKSGELAIDLPIFFASLMLFAPLIFIFKNLDAPSPSLTIYSANLLVRFSK